MANEMNRQNEQEAVRTTIVGGRPPGCGTCVGNIPRGIEVLVRKAAVDPEFKALLLAHRGEAARSIGLQLSATESLMLSAVPAAQLRSIIAATTVPPTHVPAFLGKVAAVMLAALGIVQSGCDDSKSAKPGGRAEDGSKDNVAATSRPAKPAEDQPITIAGELIVKPQSRPGTEPVVPPVPVAGVRIDRPEVPPTPGRLTHTVAGVQPEEPDDVRPFRLRPDEPPTPERLPQEAIGIRPTRPTWRLHLDVPPQPSTAPAIAPESIEVAGVRPARPEELTTWGIRPDVPPRPPTAPTTEPIEIRTPPPVYGARPKDVRIAGIMAEPPADKQPQPSTAPATQPAPEQPPREIIIFGMVVDRPQDTAVRGLRADVPRVVPPSQPTTQPATESSPPPNVTVLGVMPDRPMPVKGIRVDRPTPPASAPATQPATKPSAQTEPPIIVAGIMPTPPETSNRGLRPDKPPVTKPTSQPSSQAEPLKPDFPIAIDGIRPDRPDHPKRNK